MRFVRKMLMSGVRVPAVARFDFGCAQAYGGGVSRGSGDGYGRSIEHIMDIVDKSGKSRLNEYDTDSYETHVNDDQLRTVKSDKGDLRGTGDG